MEDTLGERHRAVRQRIGGVLILVLMEDTLGAVEKDGRVHKMMS